MKCLNNIRQDARHCPALMVLCLLGIGQTSAFAAPTVEEVLRSIEQSEQRLKIAYVESEVRMSDGKGEPLQWKESNESSAGRVWLNGRAGGPFKALISKEIVAWKDGPAGEQPYLESKSDVQSDRGRTTVHERATGPMGKATQTRTAAVSAQAVGRTSMQYMFGSGGVFTPNHWGEIIGKNSTPLSRYLSEASAAPNAKNKQQEPAELEAGEAVLNGRPCVTMKAKFGLSRDQKWYFDRERGFALVRYESIMGQTYPSCTIDVKALVKVDTDVWYPTEASYEVFVYAPGPKPNTAVVSEAVRYAYKATKVLANDDKLQEELVAPLDLPAGTVVTDEVEKRSYKVAPPDDQATKEVDDALSDAIRSATQPATVTSGKKGDRP